MLAVKPRRLLCLLLRSGSLLFVRCSFSDVVCSRAVHANGRKDNKCYDLGEKKGWVFVKFVAVVRPQFAASMCIFIWDFFFPLLIKEHTLLSHMHAVILIHKSHSVSRTHSSKHPHAQDATHTHTLLTPAVAFCRTRHFDEPGTVCECS